MSDTELLDWLQRNATIVQFWNGAGGLQGWVRTKATQSDDSNISLREALTAAACRQPGDEK